MSSQKPVHALGINPVTTASGPINCPSHTNVSHSEDFTGLTFVILT